MHSSYERHAETESLIGPIGAVEFGALDSLRQSDAKSLRTRRQSALERAMVLLLTGFCFPMATCYWLSYQPSVLYWIGRKSSLGLLTIPWLVFGQFLFSGRRTQVAALGILPASGLALLGFLHLKNSVNAQSQLRAEDCVSFPKKLRVERAWQAANLALHSCLDQRVQAVGDEGLRPELLKVMSLEQCEIYTKERQRWSPEWTYLEALERQNGCVGWCKWAPSPIWARSAPPRTADRCSMAAADALSEVTTTSKQLIVYSSVILCCSFVLGLIGNMHWSA